MNKEDFEIIYYADGTCGGWWDCSAQGVILAFDEFMPESATWFCQDCWDILGIAQTMFVIIEDTRPKTERPQEP